MNGEHTEIQRLPLQGLYKGLAAGWLAGCMMLSVQAYAERPGDVQSQQLSWTATEQSGRSGSARNNWLAQLNLSKEQKTRLTDILNRHHQETAGLQQALKRDRHQLQTMLTQGTGSKEQALALHHQVLNRQNKLAESRIRMLYDIRAELTPEQFDRFRSAMLVRQHSQRPEMLQGGLGFNPHRDQPLIGR